MFAPYEYKRIEEADKASGGGRRGWVVELPSTRVCRDAIRDLSHTLWNSHKVGVRLRDVAAVRTVRTRGGRKAGASPAKGDGGDGGGSAGRATAGGAGASAAVLSQTPMAKMLRRVANSVANNVAESVAKQMRVDLIEATVDAELAAWAVRRDEAAKIQAAKDEEGASVCVCLFAARWVGGERG